MSVTIYALLLMASENDVFACPSTNYLSDAHPLGTSLTHFLSYAQ
jgi:hypothetical protein